MGEKNNNKQPNVEMGNIVTIPLLLTNYQRETLPLVQRIQNLPSEQTIGTVSISDIALLEGYAELILMAKNAFLPVLRNASFSDSFKKLNPKIRNLFINTLLNPIPSVLSEAKENWHIIQRQLETFTDESLANRQNSDNLLLIVEAAKENKPLIDKTYLKTLTELLLEIGDMDNYFYLNIRFYESTLQSGNAFPLFHLDLSKQKNDSAVNFINTLAKIYHQHVALTNYPLAEEINLTFFEMVFTVLNDQPDVISKDFFQKHKAIIRYIPVPLLQAKGQQATSATSSQESNIQNYLRLFHMMGEEMWIYLLNEENIRTAVNADAKRYINESISNPEKIAHFWRLAIYAYIDMFKPNGESINPMLAIVRLAYQAFTTTYQKATISTVELLTQISTQLADNGYNCKIVSDFNIEGMSTNGLINLVNQLLEDLTNPTFNYEPTEKLNRLMLAMLLLHHSVTSIPEQLADSIISQSHAYFFANYLKREYCPLVLLPSTCNPT